ncbi:rhomboid family intramembrane serine protease [Falsibacillus pallidus]|uniref:Membrane associated rhomboid family serine protease n=1 Tax=Falsibacillus pallidus TaxID=493781 RepID=A0A370GNV8_9BACI|nr:rhomboid family intramembrane serine protease [Falsibacillus pallidus]RDI45432.1 membrane associated rhomboid family serine protease [Falsibacillus pallidus]
MVFMRRESIKEFLALYPITALIVLLNTMVFLASLIIGFFADNNTAIYWGGISREGIEQGEYYRLITYAFLHDGIIHFASNMIFAILLAPYIEKILGRFIFILFFIAAILATPLYDIFYTNELSVGESGFGFALFGFYLFLVLFQKEFLDKDSRVTVIIFMSIGWIASFIITNINISGHVCGFAAGFLAALFTKNLRKSIQIKNTLQM